ncbi:hypothetical protein [Mycoplasma suis]|uniref:Uncharacterized protein n=1 Tax=Mycoplasma suis (strain Illinois) TaxID=768700 RepID=F0QQ30_MYCSL|nr:hypothetical protein [Mycoplasma suis]ADX97600.1 hypothetical protein MSU_0056 [Mycoplasma suis str. Illinois]
MSFFSSLANVAINTFMSAGAIAGMGNNNRQQPKTQARKESSSEATIRTTFPKTIILEKKENNKKQQEKSIHPDVETFIRRIDKKKDPSKNWTVEQMIENEQYYEEDIERFGIILETVWFRKKPGRTKWSRHCTLLTDTIHNKQFEKVAPILQWEADSYDEQYSCGVVQAQTYWAINLVDNNDQEGVWIRGQVYHIEYLFEKNQDLLTGYSLLRDVDKEWKPSSPSPVTCEIIKEREGGSWLEIKCVKKDSSP